MDRLSVYELQDALMQIFNANGMKGVIYPDGIFGPETSNAVRLFQKMEKMPQTGEVDRELWERIQLRLDEIIRSHEIFPLPVFPNHDFVLMPGAGGVLVGIVQGLLQHLSETYRNIPFPELTYFYDPVTVSAVKLIQEKAGLDADGLLDRTTWNVLAVLYGQI